MADADPEHKVEVEEEGDDDGVEPHFNEDGTIEIDGHKFRVVVEEDADFDDAFDDEEDAENVQNVEVNEEGEEVKREGADEGDSVDVPEMARKVVTVHTDSVYVVAIAPGTANLAASGGGDDLAYLWRLSDGEVVGKMDGFKDSVACLSFNPAGNLLAAGACDGEVRVYSVPHCVLAAELTGPGDSIEWLAWHPEIEGVLACGSADSTVWMWKIGSSRPLQVFAGHTDSVTCGTFGSTGKRLYTGSLDGTIRTWNLANGVVSIAAHPDKPLLVVGATDGTAVLFHLQTKKVVGRFNAAGSKIVVPTAPKGDDDEDEEDEESPITVESVEFIADQPWVLTGTNTGVIRVWDCNSSLCRHTVSVDAGINKLRTVASPPVIMACSPDNTIHVWDTRSLEEIAVLTGHRDMVLDLAVRPIGRSIQVVSASDDHTCRYFVVDPAIAQATRAAPTADEPAETAGVTESKGTDEV